MPRGNDAPAAASELADQFGAGAGNAESLIIANNAERTQELNAASLKTVDAEATADLDLDSLSGPNGEEVLDAAVRGGVTVIVYEDEDGRLHKDTVGDDSPKTDKKQKQNARSKTTDTEADGS